MGTDEVIALALLLGSDYTEGVKGVGIVNAMEVCSGGRMKSRMYGDRWCGSPGAQALCLAGWPLR